MMCTTYCVHQRLPTLIFVQSSSFRHHSDEVIASILTEEILSILGTHSTVPRLGVCRNHSLVNGGNYEEE